MTKEELKNANWQEGYDGILNQAKILCDELDRAEGRPCLTCGRYLPKEHNRAKPGPGCKSPEACTIDMTTEEVLEHWRKKAHEAGPTLTYLPPGEMIVTGPAVGAYNLQAEFQEPAYIEILNWANSTEWEHNNEYEIFIRHLRRARNELKK